MKETIKDRLLTFIAARNLRVSAFERQCGLSSGYIKNLTASPSSVKYERMLKEFPELSRTWLLTGEGSMLNEPGEYNSVQSVGDNSFAVNDGSATINTPSESHLMEKTLDALAEQQRLLARVIEINEQQQAALQKQQDALLDLLRSKL